MRKGLIKPKMLRRGDTLAAVTLSWGGPAVFPHRYHAGKKQLEDAFGVKVIEMPHTLGSAEYLEKNPRARADDLMQAFADSSIDGIISTIGGDDSIRLIPFIDLDLITKNPKVFLGYSDTTVSHFVCQKAGLGSFYGPSIMAGFAENGGLFPYLQNAVKRVLFSGEPIGEIALNRDGWTAELLDWADPALQSQKRKLESASEWRFLQGEGIHHGHLIGGCLEVLDWLRGTPLWPDPSFWKGAILFLETSEEGPSPEAVRRILRAIASTGSLNEVNGILFGRPGGQIPPAQFEAYDQVLLDMMNHEVQRPGLPIVSGMDFGHTDPIMVLPYGRDCAIDCEAQSVSIPENAVEPIIAMDQKSEVI